MTERRSQARAAVRAFVSAAAAVLLFHGIAVPYGHLGLPPGPGPLAASQQADHDGCPEPEEQPSATGWAKPPPPPSRHGHPSQRTRAAGRAAGPARPLVSGVSPVRWTRPAGPRLPVIRC
ncbi:hypothetical protein [Sphaerisporangium corydalis]|uniref:Secreted protein n=1 Tax=Sphaerisporangium corydalis TaxID=1441875 RepID=A0ABV9ECR9_9ACTN|nr:hypothetical protein [Sphaerisporangium corydalis]